jgi:DNA ligase-1
MPVRASQIPPSFFQLRRWLLCAGWLLPTAHRSWAASQPLYANQATQATQAMLAKPWQTGLNPAEYLVSEKLDGVRAQWSGSALTFRSGRPMAAPDWFLKALPASPLDGELWAGRNRFERASGIARRQVPVDAEWRSLRYLVFDAPQAGLVFAQRAQRVAEAVASAAQPWLQSVEQWRVPDAASLQRRLQAVVAAGGEGLVLHRMDGLWAPGRSDALRKLKLAPDEEGVVVDYIAGTGKYQGQMGALLLEAPDGQRFALGSGFSNALRANPPPLGSAMTYRYRGRTGSGLPRFASFLRIHSPE